MVSIGHGLEPIMDLLMNGVLLISALEIYLFIIIMFDQVLLCHHSASWKKKNLNKI